MRWPWLLLLAAHRRPTRRCSGSPRNRRRGSAPSRRLLALPEPARCQAHHRELTRTPHTAGTEGGRRVAEYVAARFREYGLETEIGLRRAALLARAVEVELTRPAPASPGHARGPAARGSPDGDPRLSGPWHAYAKSGEVEGEVVYVNYGRAGLRGARAARRGRPRQDRAGAALQGLPRRQEPGGRAARRARARHLLRPRGGRLRPGRRVPARPVGAGQPRAARRQRLRLHRARRSADAGLGLGARRAPHRRKRSPGSCRRSRPSRCRSGTRGWCWRRSAARCGPPATGRAGALRVPRGARSRAPAREARRPPRDAHDPERDRRLRGADPDPAVRDQVVLLSNHHDAWTFGGVDPSSGTAAALELGRALGELARGARPRRTSSSGSGTRRSSR